LGLGGLDQLGLELVDAALDLRVHQLDRLLALDDLPLEPLGPPLLLADRTLQVIGEVGLGQRLLALGAERALLQLVVPPRLLDRRVGGRGGRPRLALGLAPPSPRAPPPPRRGPRPASPAPCAADPEPRDSPACP